MDEEQTFYITRTFVVKNTSLEAANKELDEFILKQLKGQATEPIDAEFREVGE